MKVIHIITTLGDGGAERTLFNICKNSHIHNQVVISLLDQGKYGELLNKLGVKLYYLKMKPNIFFILKIFSLMKILYHEKPDVVQTWMYHSDFFGSIASRLVGIKNILWNIRHSDLQENQSNKKTIWIVKLLSKLSWWLPKKIIINSKRSIKVHKELGYCSKNFLHIPNGYDFSMFKPKNKNFFSIRKKLNIRNKTPLIGLVGRYNFEKDHFNLLNALYLLKNLKIDFFCILVGKGIHYKNNDVVSIIKKLRLKNHIKLMGPQKNIPSFMSELDLHILSSNSESFPNVVAEAMACGTPCVVTDVGDAAYIVCKTGWVVPPKNPLRLAKITAKALSEIGTKKWKKRCIQARHRINKNFDINRMVKSYNNAWNEFYYKN